MRNTVAQIVTLFAIQSISTNAPPLQLSTRTAIRRRLLNWYDKNKRDLPWRRREDSAYAQWVAEIMLQQTRVDTVLNYYEPFLQRFPDVAALAKAQETTVMKAWEGLGYYRRVRNLHRAARILRDSHQLVPTSAEALQGLPGIGEYTASAIASIAYGEVAAAIDGNVARVVSRLFAIEQDVGKGTGQALVTHFARELISPSRPGDFNQAWMDLGSSICTPQAPSCPICPLQKQCKAFATDLADRLPVLSKKKPPKPVNLIVAIFVRDGKVLMVRDNGGGWWSGLWAFPTIEKKGDRSLRQTLDNLAASYNLSLDALPERVGTLRHQLTHRTLNFDIRVCRQVSETATTTPSTNATQLDQKWVTTRQLEKLPVSTAHRKIWASAMKHCTRKNREGSVEKKDSLSAKRA
jgi:A/G-specific adenine glycosylase